MKEQVQRALVARYREAWRFYHQPGVREAALSLGITHREYCDRFIRDNYPPLTWDSDTADNWRPDADAAYREAGR